MYVFPLKYAPLKILIIAPLLLFFSFRFTQHKKEKYIDDEYANDQFIRYDDFTYSDSIKTVLLYNAKSQLDYPIIPLNSEEYLILTFDELSNNLKAYNYSIVHCNANWTPSELDKNEYLNGFYENTINNYQLSFNTDLPYTHYHVDFPNEDMEITRSGNYIIIVYEDNNSSNPIITKRFMVYENKVTITMDSKRATDVNEQFYRQEIDFKINHEKYPITDPFRNLNVVLMQNYRWDNAITGLSPRFIKDNELDYNYDNENVFDGNNEYRNFDIKSINYQTINVKNIEYDPTDRLKHVHIVPDENRSYLRYYSNPDINGRFLIKRNEGDNSEIEAEYVKVHFTLPHAPPIENGNLYLFGKLSDWKFKEDLKLDYDTLHQQYTKEVLLKQGYYNYMYCFVKDGSKNTGDLSVIEGSHYETENEYTILVYYRPLNDNYDRLIGFNTISNYE